MNKLINRLRGQYSAGPNNEFRTRSFADFIPPISIEAADRIENLEEALRQIKVTENSYDDEQTVLSEIYVICEDALST